MVHFLLTASLSFARRTLRRARRLGVGPIPSHLLSRDEQRQQQSGERVQIGTQVARCCAAREEEHLQRIVNNSHATNLFSDPTFGPGLYPTRRLRPLASRRAARDEAGLSSDLGQPLCKWRRLGPHERGAGPTLRSYVQRSREACRVNTRARPFTQRSAVPRQVGVYALALFGARGEYGAGTVLVHAKETALIPA